MEQTGEDQANAKAILQALGAGINKTMEKLGVHGFKWIIMGGLPAEIDPNFIQAGLITNIKDPEAVLMALGSMAAGLYERANAMVKIQDEKDNSTIN